VTGFSRACSRPPLQAVFLKKPPGNGWRGGSRRPMRVVLQDPLTHGAAWRMDLSLVITRALVVSQVLGFLMGAKFSGFNGVRLYFQW
jgi:hypothetical protein